MSEKIWFLKRCDLFERLTPAEQRRLEASAVMRGFERGEMVYFPTEPGQSVLVLVEGRVKIKTVTPDGRETIFAFIEEGELFGELALLDDEPRKEYAEVVVRARALAIPREDLLWLMAQRPDIALHVTRFVGLRRRRIENRLRNILFRSIRERAVALLLELVESHGQARGAAWEVRLRLSHQEIANLIGATRETVTLELGQLQREGLVRIERRRITVLDHQRLADEAGETAPGPPEACSGKGRRP
jgi:CRP-like cAMP-binding protein